MSFALGYSLAVLLAMLVLFVSNRLRLDLVALMGLLALLLAGVIDVDQALAGFADPVVVMIAALFVVGASLFQTGVADIMGRQVERLAGEGFAGLLLVVMLVTAVLSAFLSSTGTVAVMLPVVLAIARRRQISPSMLLMPLAFASLLGGMTTLIGTPPNLIVSAQLAAAGLEPLGFFDFTLIGLAMLAIGMVYMTLVAPRLLPPRQPTADGPVRAPGWQELFRHYGLSGHITRLRVPADSPLVAAQFTSAALRSDYAVTVLALVSYTRRGRWARRAEANTLIRAGDELQVVGSPEAIDSVVRRFGLQPIGEANGVPAGIDLVDALVPPRSGLIGRSLRDLRLHSGAGVTVIGQRPAGSQGQVADLDRPLKAGDALLMSGILKSMKRVARSPRDLVLLHEESEDRGWDPRRGPLAIAVLLGMMVVMAMNLMPNVQAVLLAAVLLVLLGCVSVPDAYRSINFESVILIAAILPMATALEVTGGLDMASRALMDWTGAAGPIALLAALFLFTSVLSQIVSNTATTVLVAPIAISAGLGLGINPQAAVITVAIAASAAFATPVASPVNTLVLSAGAYRFGDFARIGIPLQLLLLVATLLLVPLLFPL